MSMPRTRSRTCSVESNQAEVFHLDLHHPTVRAMPHNPFDVARCKVVSQCRKRARAIVQDFCAVRNKDVSRKTFRVSLDLRAAKFVGAVGVISKREGSERLAV